MLNPDTVMMSLSNLNFLSPDSRCYSFDHRANGYSLGEGFGVVVIKLLSEALWDDNTIRAVIIATSSNQDGRTPGITQPSKDAQESLIRDTYLSAGLSLSETRFFEAHGTGTPIGDPTEAAAIGAVFKDQSTLDEPLFVVAVKSNIGHLGGALTGAYQQNEEIQDVSCKISTLKLFLWSSADEGGLNRWATVYKDFLSASDVRASIEPNKFLEDLAYTLSRKRSILLWKSFIVAQSVEDLIFKLSCNMSKPCRSSGAMPVLGFVFTGQGAQWHGMGRELFDYPVYNISLKRADEYLRTLQCPWSLIKEFRMAKKSPCIDDPAWSQPLCTALQVALVDLLASWNVHPSAVVGHSSGEIAAAYCVGAISRESAWKLAYYRGLLASRLADRSCRERGSMMAVALSEDALAPYIAQIPAECEIAIGCLNSPTNTTVTGREEAIVALQAVLEREQIFARQLPVGVAYHSVQMEEVANDYLALIQDLAAPDSWPSVENAPLMYSTVSGQLDSTKQLRTEEYGTANMCSKVRFSEALSRMCSTTHAKQENHYPNDMAQVNHLIELGPHAALRRPVKENLGEVGYSSALRMDSSATETILHLAGELFRRHRPHELLGTPTADWNALKAKWRNIIKLKESPWISDHKFNGVELYPAAGMIVMAIEAARQISAANATRPIKGYRLTDVTFLKAVRLSMSAEGVETQFYLRPEKIQGASISERSEFRLYMVSNHEWIENCRGTITLEYEEDENEVDRGYEAREARSRHKEVFAHGQKHCNLHVDATQMYDNLSAFGFGFGPTFKSLDEVSYSDDGEATASIKLHAWKNKMPAGTRNIQPHVIHPTALDEVFHLTVAAITRGGWAPIRTMVPTRLEDLWISNDFVTQPELESIKVYSVSKPRGYREAEFDILALNPVTEDPLIVMDGYRTTAVTSLDVFTSGKSHWRRPFYSIHRKPDLDLLDKEELSRHCQKAVDPMHLYSGEFIDEAEIACLHFMTEALEAVSVEHRRGLSSHLASYIDWMRHHCNGHDAQAILSSLEGQRFTSETPYPEALINRLEKSGREGKVYVTVRRHLTRILRGEVDPLELLFKESLLQSFYSSSTFVANYQKISAFVDLSAHKNPNQSILEIGAGTGGAAGPILRVLGPEDLADEHGTPRFGQYTYTDISPGIFQDAKERFSRHHDRLAFKTLDIGRDPLQQGFDKGMYDMVIASCVLHATTDLNTTLGNTRKLLKAGGKLTSEGAFCVFLPELEAPFLFGITAQDFKSLQHIVRTCKTVLWVTQDGGQPAQKPETGLAIGFGRCMSSENSKLDFITLALENTSSPAKIGEYVVKIIQSAIVNPQDGQEQEYIEQNAVLCINRVVEDNEMNNIIFSAVVPQNPERRTYGGRPGQALALTISSPGLLDTLHFADDSAEKVLGADEVEIKVKAVGVNFKNVMVALGQLPDKSLGQECAGTVTRIGDGVRSAQLGVGDRVCCVTHGAFKTYARSHLSSVHKIPDGMTFTTAAALPVAFCTAYYSLHHVAGLKEGQCILIHAAAGGVGQAAIQLAQLAKAVVFITVGTEQKRQLMMDLYKIPEEHIFSSWNLSFAQGINRLTKGRGVDVVLNSLAGQSLRQSLDCVAPLGRFVEIGKLDMYMREHLPMAPFLRGVTFASVDLAIIAEQAQHLMAELMEAVMSLAHTSIHSPQPLNVFRVSELESAFRFLQSGKNAGKTVVEIHEEDLVPTRPSTKPSWSFDEHATYVIAGGLGGQAEALLVGSWVEEQSIYYYSPDLARGMKWQQLYSKSLRRTKSK
ncbi:MAG: hypothetical protein Q9201_000481 [Fulgogasparrea decipioides]